MIKPNSGGKTLNDRKLAAEVRTLSMKMIKKYLEGDDEAYKRQLILKLATTVLPRINEISGPDGGELPIPIYGGKSIGRENPTSQFTDDNIESQINDIQNNDSNREDI